MRTIVLLIFVFLLSQMGWSQVRLSGEVRNGDDALDQVTIKVVENDKVLRTLAVNRRGKYETEIPFGKQYVLVFTRPFMFPVSIRIDTRMFEALPETVYDVPLNMSMFYRFEGIQEEAFEESIGVIKRTGQGEDAFSFVPDADVIERLRALQNESKTRHKAGEEPIEKAQEAGIDDSLEAFSEKESTDPTADGVEPEIKEAAVNDRLEPAHKSELDIAAQKRHHAHQEEVSALNRSAQRSSWEGQRSAQQNEESRVQEEIDQSKQARKEWSEQKEESEYMLAEARAGKQTRLVQMGVEEVVKNQPLGESRPRVELVDYRTNDGLWLSEEHLLISENGKRIEYVKARYDWFLFEVVTCSKNGEEIAEQEYEQVKALVGI
jgi:hypothetical protein